MKKLRRDRATHGNSDPHPMRTTFDILRVNIQALCDRVLSLLMEAKRPRQLKATASMMNRVDAAVLPAPPGMGGSRPVGRTWTLDDEDLLETLTRFVGRLCPSWFSADQRQEVFQETCLRLTQLADGGKRQFCCSFLWQTATFVRNELVRKFGRRKQCEIPFKDFQKSNPGEDDPIPFDPPTDELDPEHITRGSETGRQIRACLAQLPVEQRHAVVLRLTGYSYREVACSLGCNEKQADNAINRGLRKLRELLRENKGVQDEDALDVRTESVD